jgi:O-antigen ligase
MMILQWLIVSLYLLLPLGQLQRLPLGIAGVSIYVHDLVLAALWGWILWRLISTGVEKSLFKKSDPSASDKSNLPPLGMKKNGKLLKLFWFFTAVALISWLINLLRWGNESIIGLGYLVRWVLLVAPLFLIQYVAQNPDTENGRKTLHVTCRMLRVAIFITAVFGWVQYLIFPDLTRMKYFGWDDHFYRLTGTILDPNFFGILMVMGLGLEFSNFQFSIFKILKKLFYLVTLAFTYSRASYLAWLVLLFGWGINKIFAEPIKGGFLKLFKILLRSLKTYTVYFWLAVSAIIFVLLPRPEGEGGDLTRTASISGRLQSYHQTWEIIKENPLFGVGFNNYRLARKDKSRIVPTNHAAGGSDNSFLFVWATTGILGLGVFIWLIFSLRPWWLILPVVVHSFFNNTLFFPWVLIYLWGIQSKYEN